MWMTYVVVGLLVGLSYILVRMLYFFVLNYYVRAYFTGKPTILFNGFDPFDRTSSVPPLADNLKRGDIVVRDFRDETAKKKMEQRFKNERQPIRIVSVNIEMGKQINKVIQHLSELDADIIFLQEVDINSVRTGFVDTIGEIANALKMNSLFTVEIVMVTNKKVRKHFEKGVISDTTNVGYEGNGILSKFDFVETKGLLVSCAREKFKHTDKTHTEAVVVCDIPHFGLLGCYCLHLDTNWTGVKGRVRQYLEILEDVANQRTKYLKVNKNFHQVLGGDLNTLCCGLARCLPQLACNFYSSIGTLGQYEATYFQKHAVEYGNKTYKLDFRDPFDKVKDITFYAFNGLFQAKLDWLLLSAGLKSTHWEVCPPYDKCSDHQWILTDIELA